MGTDFAAGDRSGPDGRDLSVLGKDRQVPVTIHLAFRIGSEESIAVDGHRRTDGRRGGDWFYPGRSPLTEADRVVAELFHEAIYWCIFLVVSITAMLASTAVQLIRGADSHRA